MDLDAFLKKKLNDEPIKKDELNQTSIYSGVQRIIRGQKHEEREEPSKRHDE
jgi:hypothetical protein